MYKILLILVASFFVSQNLYAQKKIKLTKNNSKKTLILAEGMRVSYSVNGDTHIKKGILKKVDQTSCLVDDKTVAYQDLSRIGRKRAGSGFFQVLCAVVGVSLIKDALAPAPTPQCNGCQIEESDDSGLIAFELIGGTALVAIAINSGARNSARDVVHKWKLEVID